MTQCDYRTLEQINSPIPILYLAVNVSAITIRGSHSRAQYLICIYLLDRVSLRLDWNSLLKKKILSGSQVWELEA